MKTHKFVTKIMLYLKDLRSDIKVSIYTIVYHLIAKPSSFLYHNILWLLNEIIIRRKKLTYYDFFQIKNRLKTFISSS